MNKYFVACALMVLISSASQLLLKNSATENHVSLKHYYLNWKVIIAYSIYFAITFINSLFIYKGLKLSEISILESLGYIFVPLLSYAFLKERMTKAQVFGISLIILGVIIFNIV